MLIVHPDPGPELPAPFARACPYCGGEMITHATGDHFFHPGAVGDDCILSGKGFHLNDTFKWNRRVICAEV